MSHVTVAELALWQRGQLAITLIVDARHLEGGIAAWRAAARPVQAVAE